MGQREWVEESNRVRESKRVGESKERGVSSKKGGELTKLWNRCRANSFLCVFRFFPIKLHKSECHVKLLVGSPLIQQLYRIKCLNFMINPHLVVKAAHLVATCSLPLSNSFAASVARWFIPFCIPVCVLSCSSVSVLFLFPLFPHFWSLAPIVFCLCIRLPCLHLACTVPLVFTISLYAIPCRIVYISTCFHCYPVHCDSSLQYSLACIVSPCCSILFSCCGHLVCISVNVQTSALSLFCITVLHVA